MCDEDVVVGGVVGVFSVGRVEVVISGGGLFFIFIVVVDVIVVHVVIVVVFIIIIYDHPFDLIILSCCINKPSTNTNINENIIEFISEIVTQIRCYSVYTLRGG